MNIYIFSEEERQFLKDNINEVISIFCESHEELKKKMKDNKKDLKQLFESNDSIRIFFSESSYTFKAGYCFYFTRIMKTIFPDFEFYFNEDVNHVIIGNGNLFFDINGVVSIFSEQLDMYTYFLATKENLQTVRNRFLYLDNEIYIELKSIFYNKIKEYLNVHVHCDKSYDKKHN